MMLCRFPSEFFYEVVEDCELEIDIISIEDESRSSPIKNESLTPCEKEATTSKILKDTDAIWKSIDDEYADSIENEEGKSK